jgi:acyl-CoA thioesterase I
VQSRATGDIKDFLTLAAPRETPIVIAGASIVRGRASVDFVALLRTRLPARTFVNAGVNGNVAWELLERLDDVIACRPSTVVILIGTNDVQASLSARAARQVMKSKHMTELPSMEFFERCMEDIVTRLQESGASVGLCSLPPIGEDLEAVVNVRLCQANDALRRVSERTGAGYLAVHERLVALLETKAAGPGPAWTGSWWPGVRSLVAHFVLGRSYDDVAQGQGWLLSPDGVHMDSRGATTIADVIEGWLAQRTTS